MSMSEAPSRPDRVDWAAALVALASLAVAAWVWRHGPPGLVPSHLDLHGRVNGWSSRETIAKLILLITTVSAAVYLVLGAVTLGPNNPDGSARRRLRAARLLLVLVTGLITALMTAIAYGAATAPRLGGGRLMPAFLALIFLVVGAFIGKSAPNPFVGVRTYWTLRSRLAWDKSNRLAGRLFFWTGLLGLPLAFLTSPVVSTSILVIVVLATAVASVVESWRVWRTDPDRQAP